MAPSPVLTEPKEPDKKSEKGPDDTSRKDQQNMSNDNISNSKDKSNVESINIHEIGEGELKSLLDEAYSFRSPKDREGKSILFQKFLNEVEESDAGKKKLIDHSRGLVDSLKASSTAIESSHHDSVGGDQSFLHNILGGCEREKKKKKNGKRDSSSSNGGSSRRPKFSHSLKINSGSQSSVYNGNISGGSSSSSGSNNVNVSTNSNGSSTINVNANSYSSTNRGSSRGAQQQSLSARGSNTSSKPATLLTSSSNIDIPMVTTYNNEPTQCIMTPVVTPRKQQKTELMLLQDRCSSTAGKASSSSDESVKNEDIELKSLDEMGASNYTTRASLEIGGNASKELLTDAIDDDDSCGLSTEHGLISCSAKTSNALVNGNVEMSSQHSTVYRPFNGMSDNKEDDSGSITNEIDEEKQLLSKKRDKKNSESSSTDVVTANGTSSVDEAKTFMQQKNFWTAFGGYPLTATPFLILNNADTTGHVIHSAKESLETRKSGDEGANYQLKDGSGSVSRLKKKKVKKPDGNSYLSENIEGHCGDKSIEYLLDYIEKNCPSPTGGGHAVNSHSISGTAHNQKSPRTKHLSVGGGVKCEKQSRGKACTDEDIRQKKPVTGAMAVMKTKEHLKKSTSLEDLRHSSSSSRSKPNKKQSSVDDSHYAETKAKSSSPIPTSLPPSSKETSVVELPTAVIVDTAIETTRLYYDSPFEDAYTDEFHLVTKKQRRKKRRSKSRPVDQKSAMATVGSRASMSHGGFLPHNYTDRGHEGGGSNFKRATRSTENRHRSRRKSVSSVVPSDKISDSDSIHSLPVSSTTPKCRIKKKSTSSGCTPQASYADIAKSPQCQSSTMLNGDSTTAAKWQTTKTFSNVSSSSSSSASTNATLSNSSSADTSNTTTADSLNHSDTVELVSSSTKYEDHVELDDGCDQLLSYNPSSNSCSGSDSPAALVNNGGSSSVDENKNLDNDSSCNIKDSSCCNSSNNNINNNDEDDNNNNNTDNSINRIGIALKQRSKPNKGDVENTDTVDNVVNDNACTNVNSYSQVCFNGRLEKSKDGLNTSTDTNSSNNNNNDININNNNSSSNNDVNPSKTKNKKNKKKNSLTEQQQQGTNAVGQGNNIVSADKDKNSNDLFIEFTLTAPKTKCSQTQTDQIEVNNNACSDHLTVEETVVVKNNRNNGLSSTLKESSSEFEKLSTTTEKANDGSRVLLLPTDGTESSNTISVGFNVDTGLLEEAGAVSNDQRRADLLKEMVERSSMYNVIEVIQYVNMSWNEVMDIQPSATRVQYYDAK